MKVSNIVSDFRKNSIKQRQNLVQSPSQLALVKQLFQSLLYDLIPSYLGLGSDLLRGEAVVAPRHLDEGVGLHLVLLLLVKEVGLWSGGEPRGGLV